MRSRWERFWFAPASPLGLGITRALLSAGLLWIYRRSDFAAYASVSPLFYGVTWFRPPIAPEGWLVAAHRVFLLALAGTNTWTLTWREVGETDGATRGRVMVAASGNCAVENCLRLGGSNVSLAGRGIYRPAPLALVTSATLTFKTRAQVTSSTTGTVNVQISQNNGNTWVTLDTFSVKTTDSAQVARTYDISAYATAFTVVRFLGTGTVNGYLHVDDVQVEYSRLSNSYIRSIQANNVWKNTAAPGEGITVAVVDGGIAANHVDLTNNYGIASACLCGFHQGCRICVQCRVPGSAGSDQLPAGGR